MMLIFSCFTIYKKYPAKLVLFSNNEFQKMCLYKNPAIIAGSLFLFHKTVLKCLYSIIKIEHNQIDSVWVT